jgi:DNA-binding CsgD family transcriptional regulator
MMPGQVHETALLRRGDRLWGERDCSASDRTMGSVPATAPAHCLSADVIPAGVLNYLMHGVIITDRTSRPLFVNLAAAEVIAQSDGLRIDSARLRAAHPPETAAIRRMIEAASDAPDGESCSAALCVSRPSMRRSLTLVVAPMRGAQARLPGLQPSAIVFITDPEREAPVSSAFLQQVYGLTRAEAEVAVKVERGEGLQAVAETLGIALCTARTHLQHIFEKTGTRRQAELVRLIGESCAGLRFLVSGRWASPSPLRQ